MAEHWRAAVDSAAANRTVRFIAHSYGGNILYEMLRISPTRRWKVKSIILLDSMPHDRLNRLDQELIGVVDRRVRARHDSWSPGRGGCGLKSLPQKNTDVRLELEATLVVAEQSRVWLDPYLGSIIFQLSTLSIRPAITSRSSDVSTAHAGSNVRFHLTRRKVMRQTDEVQQTFAAQDRRDFCKNALTAWLAGSVVSGSAHAFASEGPLAQNQEKPKTPSPTGYFTLNTCSGPLAGSGVKRLSSYSTQDSPHSTSSAHITCSS